MPTIPPEQARPESHRQRQVAESFGENAGRYDRARPSYPGALLERIVAASPGRDVLDIGCGTGIVARLLQAAGCRVLGVDPDPRMAGVARQRGLDVEVSAIEAWDPAGRAFDAAVAGQAWHWVDPVAGAARAAQALRPGAPLVVFWNAGQAPPDLSVAFNEVYGRVTPGPQSNFWTRPIVDMYLTGCAKAADGMRQAGGFDEPEQWRFDWDRHYTRDEWLDQVPTFGGHSQLPPRQQEALLAGIGDAIDAMGGSFVMSYATVAVAAARAGAS